jgi:hypothetical protein
MSASARMSRAEQDNLLRLGRLNVTGAKASAKARTAELIADFEMRLAADYAFDQREVWAKLTAQANAAVKELDAKLAEDCRKLGIPPNMRPSLHLSWHGRGENASKDRRTELRRVALSRAVGLERAAVEAIEAGGRKFATAVLTASLNSAEARELLTALPTAESLMPALDYQSIGRSLLAGPEAQTLHVGQALLPDESDAGEEEPA